MNEVVGGVGYGNNFVNGCGYSYGCGNSGWTTTGAVLVLFILLVIIAKAFC